MRSAVRTWGAMLLAVGLALPAAACGDDSGDGGNNPDGPANIDAADDIDAPEAATFTRFVIDLVQNQTAGNTDPRPYADFSTLDDPDGENPAAYDPLFP